MFKITHKKAIFLSHKKVIFLITSKFSHIKIKKRIFACKTVTD